MKKILLWGRMTPYESDTASNILLKNRFASNPGNLLFTYGVARTVMTRDAHLVPFFSEDVDRLLKDVQRVNAEYACAVIPLANAFRKQYIPKLEALTRFIRGVKIPCYVIGVGIQAGSVEAIRRGFAFDGAVRDFVSAVLDKSAKLGLRGEFTAQYLQQLGFAPDRHFTVIGCPAAYITGSKCAGIRPKPFDEIRRVSVNGKPDLPRQVHDLIARSLSGFDQVNFVSQDLYELWKIYFDYGAFRTSAPDYYPFSPKAAPEWKTGRVTGFLRAADWLSYMQGVDLSFGSRIHGNLAAVVSGTPALVMMSDLRVRELAQYHGLPGILAQDIASETKLRDLYENADFAAFERKYPANFAHYVSFLNENGIHHIFGDDEPAFGQAPCDLAVAQAAAPKEIYLGMPVSAADRLRRAEMYAMLVKYKLDARSQAKKQK